MIIALKLVVRFSTTEWPASNRARRVDVTASVHVFPLVVSDVKQFPGETVPMKEAIFNTLKPWWPPHTMKVCVVLPMIPDWVPDEAVYVPTKLFVVAVNVTAWGVPVEKVDVKSWLDHSGAGGAVVVAAVNPPNPSTR
jgi:hypothetical protein